MFQLKLSLLLNFFIIVEKINTSGKSFISFLKSFINFFSVTLLLITFANLINFFNGLEIVIETLKLKIITKDNVKVQETKLKKRMT